MKAIKLILPFLLLASSVLLYGWLGFITAHVVLEESTAVIAYCLQGLILLCWIATATVHAPKTTPND